MVKSESGMKLLKQRLHSAFVIFWLIISTVGFGLIVIIFSFISSRLANQVVRLWGKLLTVSAGIRIEIQGLEKLDKKKNYIFIANHLSVFDIPVLYAYLPFKVGFIAKKELFKIPLFGRIMLSSNSLPVDRGSARQARKSIDRAIANIKKANTSIVIFPEGTRSSNGEIGPFKQASFTLPIESKLEIVPIALCGGDKILKKNSLLINSGKISGMISDPISFSEDKTKLEISSEVRDIIFNLKNELDRAN